MAKIERDRTTSVPELAGFIFPQPSCFNVISNLAGFIFPQPSCSNHVPAFELQCCGLAFSRLVQVPTKKVRAAKPTELAVRASWCEQAALYKIPKRLLLHKLRSSISTALYMAQTGVVQRHEVPPR